jgi:CDP-glucose 4,6-dehydratase
MVTAQFWRGRKVLLTGHTGFKGTWLALWLQAWGAEVTGFSLDPDTDPSMFLLTRAGQDLHDVRGNVCDLDALLQVMEQSRAEIVLHLAAQSLVRGSYEDPLETYATNVMGTATVLEALRRSPFARAAVIVTSDKCYENRERVAGYREDEPLGGADPYSSSKACAELVAAAYRRSFFNDPSAVRIATARAGNVVGGGDWAKDRLIPDVFRALLTGSAVEIRNPAATRPWQHVLDPLAGYLALAERLYERTPGVDEAWNFGPDDADLRTVATVAEALLSGWDPPGRWIRAGESGPHEARLLKVDSSKAKLRLGWHPRLDIKAALSWTVNWYLGFKQGEDAREMTLKQIERYCALIEPDR